MSLSDVRFSVGPDGFSYAYFSEIKGFLNRSDCDQLIKHAKALPDGAKYAEIGSFMGCSALLVALNSTSTVWAHDIWSLTPDVEPCECPSECFFKFYKEIMKNNLCNRIIPIIGDSLKTVALHENGTLDLAFVDGDHRYAGALGDLENILPKMKKGGIILAHDCARGSECLQALKTFSKNNSIEFEILDGTSGMARMVVT